MRALIGRKPMFYQSIKHRNSVFYCFSSHYLYIITQMKKPKPCIKHSGHLRTLEKCRKHSPVARFFATFFLVFSNARRVLSQCYTRLRLLYLLNEVYVITAFQGSTHQLYPGLWLRGLWHGPLARGPSYQQRSLPSVLCSREGSFIRQRIWSRAGPSAQSPW